MIFQQFNIVKRLSVIENVLSGGLGYQPAWRSTLRMFSRDERRRALVNLKRVGLLDHAYKRADELSGGEQQRVAIARTLMQEPAIILADEPVSSLDPKLSRVVLDILERVCREDGITALVSLHTLDVTREYADRVVGLKDGRIVFDGATAELTDSYRRFRLWAERIEAGALFAIAFAVVYSSSLPSRMAITGIDELLNSASSNTTELTYIGGSKEEQFELDTLDGPVRAGTVDRRATAWLNSILRSGVFGRENWALAGIDCQDADTHHSASVSIPRRYGFSFTPPRICR